MLNLEGYHIQEQLHVSNNSRVYRAIRQAHSQTVILKVLQGDYPTPKQLSNYKQEYDITCSLSLPGVVEVYDLLQYRNTLVMVLEDFGGRSLEQEQLAGQLDLTTFLRLAIQMCDILGQIHQARIMHKDINPANIVLNAKTGVIKIIDFGLATKLSREYLTFINPEGLEGTLAYISPEQTGRMNRGVDYRTDLYSLGVTLYELWTGQLPFMETDPMGLVHAHIAKEPIPPLELLKIKNNELKIDNPAYALVSDIIMKLLAKNAEDRYQSAHGLIYDLERVQEYGLRSKQNEGNNNLPHPYSLILGSQDFSGRFQIPQKLYGREAEIETLLAGFERVSQTESKAVGFVGSKPTALDSPSELLLIAGYSGMGKTALVQEVYKPITARRGYFVVGKFDQYQRNVPYFSLVQAFQGLMQQLLIETEAQIAAWRDKLLAALGPNGQVIAEVIPDVMLIIGSQPALPELGPNESQNRFKLVLQQFIGVFTQQEHPLVLFLDDLQWADEASLNLLQLLLISTDNRHLYVIGAYRDNEVSGGHPLLLTLNEIAQAGVQVETIHLLPLSLAHVTLLIEETVHQTGAAVNELAALVMAKTRGNPFFVNEFLKNLYDHDLLRFDSVTKSWQWQLAEIQQQALTDNVVDLMVAKLQQLPMQTQRALQLAACMGNQFELINLSVVLEQSPPEVAQQVWGGLTGGLIIPLNEAYKWVMHGEMANKPPPHHFATLPIEVTYKFAHDRIQQAAYSLIPETERAGLHWRIGQLLLASLPESDWAERVFEVVNHLNQGRTLITTAAQRRQLIELNLLAGNKAKQSIAYQSAKVYLAIALELLPEMGWQTDYHLTLGVYQAYGETEFLLSNHEAANELLAEALVYAQTNHEKAAIQFIKIAQLTGLGQYAEATETAIALLGMFGMKMPRLAETDLIQQATEAEIVLYRQNMASRSIESLADLPDMTDETMLLCSQTIGMTVPALVIALPHLLPLYTIKYVNISIEYGLSEAMPINFVFLSSVQMVVLNDFGATYKFSKLAVKLHEERFSNLSLRSKVYHMHAFFCLLGEHISEGLKYQRLCYRVGIETGDLVFAAYGITGVVRFLTPLSLTDVLIQGEIAKYFSIQVNNIPMLIMTNLFISTAYALQGRNPRKGELDNEQFSSAEFLASFGEVPVLAGYFKRATLLVYVLLGMYEAAWPIARERTQWLAGHADATVWSDYSFYAGLMAVELIKDDARQSECLEMLQACLHDLDLLAQHCASNFAHPYLILQAEKARLDGRTAEAMLLYKQGIASARANGFWEHEAVGSELAGQFYMELGFAEFAQIYFRQAHYAYQLWGATAKVAQLEEKYPELKLSMRYPQEQGTVRSSTTMTHSSQHEVNHLHSLDLISVIKAVQAISSQINLNSLLEKMMQIVVENAGAQRGLLVLKRGHEWRVEAKLETSPESIQILSGIPIEAVGGQSGQPELSVSMTHYVIRTQKPLVLNDARQDERFGHVPYIQQRQPKSVLCLPLVNQGEVRGVLYLENNLSTGVFTPEHVDILQLLSSQMAISLENSFLYNHLEQLVEARTWELKQTLDNLQSTQNQLVESEKMAALGGLVAGVAHEINTPIGIAVTSASFLEDKTKLVTDAFQEGRLGKAALKAYFQGATQSSRLILSNLERASELVRSFKQVAVDQSNLEKRIFKVKTYLEELLMSLNPQLKRHHVEVVLQGDEAIELNSYPGAFSQVITNLLINSIRHGYGEGERGTLRLQISQKGSHVEVRYSDDGQGMSAEVLKRLYEPFFTTARHRGGTGLGMHIVYNLVTQKMGGTISCESEIGHGTVFTLLFPS